MVHSARHYDSDSDEDFEFDEDVDLGILSPGERACPPPSRLGGGGLLRTAVAALLAGGGGWAYLHAPPDWRDQLQAGMAAVSSAVRPAAPEQIAAAAMALPVAPIAEPPQQQDLRSERQIADTPGHDAGEAAAQAPESPASGAPAAEVTTGAIEPPADAAPDEASQPLPPPAVDPADPFQKRAFAVGLHPDISRAVLSRLTAADYRNAGTAIKTAVATTPDDKVFVWPLQRKPELALFRIHFVPGAAPTCRRYVVEVTKDGWSTTAPPMEKCGTRALVRKADASASNAAGPKATEPKSTESSARAP
jgi:hypothetical protein